MKKRIILFALAAATIMAAGCKKDGDKTFINATITEFTNDSKVFVDDDKFSCWQRGDAVLVNGEPGTISNTNNGGHTGKIALENEPTTTTLYSIYPATNATYNSTNNTYSVHLPSMQKCIVQSGHQVVNALMGAQGEDKLDFYNLCALLKVKLPSTLNVTDIYVTTFTTDANNNREKTNKRLWGNGTVTFNGNGARPTLSELSRSPQLVNGVVDGGDTIYLHVVDRPSDGIYYITVPEVTGVNYEVRVNYTVAGSDQNYFYHIIKRQSGNNNQLLANQIGVVDFGSITIPDPTNPDPNDFIPGIYSVSPTKKVNFAKGNLVYWPAASSNQWTYNVNQYTTSGHSVTTHGNTPTGGSSEYPKMSAEDNNGVIVDDNGYGSATSFSDWGENYIGAAWFTLSAEEWTYLLNTRPVSFARYAKVQVNGANGLLLFPDEFLWPDDDISKPTNLNSPNAAFNQRNFSIDEFSALEAAGCVFLRANGTLTHTGNPTINNSGEGFYWTSDYSAGQTQTTTYLYFGAGSVSTTGNTQNHEGTGMCVRLARLAE